MSTVSVHDLLEEIRMRDEAIDSLVVAYFKLEQDYQKLKEKRCAEEDRGAANLVAWVLDSTADCVPLPIRSAVHDRASAES